MTEKTYKKNPRVSASDVIIAQNLRRIRSSLKMTLASAAKTLNISLQQYSKYENGVNRIASGTLATLATVLGVHINHFFEGCFPSNFDDKKQNLDKRDIADLVKAFNLFLEKNK